MTKKELYMSLPCDLSGSMSKNRFRLELLWGISKMFDIYYSEDFCVVFDLVCDIEVHFNDSLEFYQIKTHKIQSPYTFSAVSKIDKKSGQSILGKLFKLVVSDDETIIKVSLVSNAYFKIEKKTKSDVNTFCFDDLDDKSKNKIKDTLKKELNKDIDLKNVYFVYTSMNLLEPQNDIYGKIITCFEKIKRQQPKRPNALCRLIVETAIEKACYEMNSMDYCERLQNKGINKAQLDEMLNQYIDNTDMCFEEVKKYIDSIPDISHRKKLKMALIRIFELSNSSLELKNKEKEISDYINININKLSQDFAEIVNEIFNEFSSKFSLEYNESEIYVFVILILKKWEEGKYEKADF